MVSLFSIPRKNLQAGDKLANRTAHVSFGFILGMIYIPIDIIVINNNLNFPYLKNTWPFWILALMLTILGSEGPDFDQLYNFMSHRDIITHSAFYPGIFFGIGIWFRLTTNHVLVTVFIPFLIAYASHLFLDYFPNIDTRDLYKGELRIKEKKGTFLMHMPFLFEDRKGKKRKTLDVKHTERWLLVNAVLTFAMAMLLSLAKYYYPLPPLSF
ncbi:MAG: hypothetical protein DRP02_05530 [Candidatus Gerdarchaeota archaeon]|nr:MAG: hypothetical protein DRP02_05530 [Candidatus Gerdarchaeota archaeon]